MSVHATSHQKRLRGAILEIVHDNHRAQQSPHDYLSLWGMLQGLGHKVGRNDVITTCQDLKDRGYLDFEQKRNEWTNDVELNEIKITPRGRDLIERTKRDEAIILL